jgi:hypothetical protein
MRRPTKLTLLDCCTHLDLKGRPMPVNTSSIPLREWAFLGRRNLRKLIVLLNHLLKNPNFKLA